jgi:hypothetical protein
VQECFQQAKNEAGLDHYQVRTWRARYAHITLSMPALAWLPGPKALAAKRRIGIHDHDIINLTLPKIRRLVHQIPRHTHEPKHVWSRPRWRRRRQHQARISHHHTRSYPPKMPLQHQ